MKTPHQDTSELIDQESEASVSSSQVLFDQTRFSEEVAMSAPSSRKRKVEEVSPQPRQPLALWKIIGLVVIVLLAVTFAVLAALPPEEMMGQRQNNPEQQVDSGSRSQLARDLELLREDVEKADPVQSDLAFPPVDFRLELEDASTIEQLRRQNERDR